MCLFYIWEYYTMTDAKYDREEERLDSFANWPLDYIDGKLLAMIGFYYTGRVDATKCQFCGISIGHWERGDDPISEHLYYSPNCPLLRRRHTTNVPIDEDDLNMLLPMPSYDECGTTEMHVLADTLPPTPPPPSEIIVDDDHRHTENVRVDEDDDDDDDDVSTYVTFPEYAVESTRLQSFQTAGWPPQMKQSGEQMAEAGFFYTGFGDRVKCFSCGLIVKDWQTDDKPWDKHAIFMRNKCRYYKLIKGVDDTTTIPTPIDINEDPPTTTSDEQEDDEENETRIYSGDRICKICLTGEYDTAFVPCGHVVACAKCASSIIKCPICRKRFNDILRIYHT